MIHIVFPILADGGATAAAVLAVLGVVSGGFGAWLHANAAKMAQRRLLNAANVGGADVGGATNESLDNILGTLDKSADIARGSTLADQATYDQLLDSEIPGYRNIQKQRIGIAQSMMAGQIPDDVREAVYRRDAAKASDGGYSGARFQDELSARDLGLTSLDIQNRGMSYASDVIRNTPISPLTRTSSYLGPLPSQVFGVREQDAQRRQDILRQYATQPGGTQVWGNWLTGMGGMMAGAGFSGLTGGLAGGGGGNMAGGSNGVGVTSSYPTGNQLANVPANDPGWAWQGAQQWYQGGGPYT